MDGRMDNLDIDKFIWPVWRAVLTKYSIPADALKQSLDEYASARNKFIIDEGNRGRGIRDTKTQWYTILVEDERLQQYRNRINEHQDQIGLPTWNILSAQEMKGMEFQPNTLADAYADSLEIIKSFQNRRFSAKELLFGTYAAWNLRNAVLLIPIDVYSVDLHGNVCADLIMFDQIGTDLRNYYDFMLRTCDIRLLYRETKYDLTDKNGNKIEGKEEIRIDGMCFHGGNAYTFGKYSNFTDINRNDNYSQIKKNIESIISTYSRDAGEQLLVS